MTAGTAEEKATEPAARSILSSVIGIVLVTSLAALTGLAMSMLLQTPPRETATTPATEHTAGTQPARLPKGWLVKPLPTILTNLAGDRRAWVRLELSVALPPDLANDTLLAQIGQDTLTYLRTVKPEDIQGAHQVMALREELEERVRVRTGKAGAVLFRSFVVE